MTKAATGRVPDCGQTSSRPRSRGLFSLLRPRNSRDLRAVGARPISKEEHLRLWNIAEGLATELGVAAPALWVVKDEGSNSFVSGGSNPVLGFTEEILGSYTRTELEAVVAHGLARLTRAGKGRVEESGAADDISAAAVTRYPPALAAALRKAAPRPDRGSIRWFVPDAAGRTAEARAQEVLDL
ncbi:MAG: heat shock protein HtpX [Actinomycetota bacterium]|nr:heat shock protein HtpX [Actinomycetota bacterium]